MASEGYTQVAPDSTGDKIRDLAIDIAQPDGTVATVNQQVVTLADRLGRLIDNDTGWRDATLGELVAIRELLEVIAEAVTPH